jgi:hypothetical protein
LIVDGLILRLTILYVYLGVLTSGSLMCINAAVTGGDAAMENFSRKCDSRAVRVMSTVTVTVAHRHCAVTVAHRHCAVTVAHRHCAVTVADRRSIPPLEFS